MRLDRLWPGDTLAIRILAPGAAALIVLLAVSLAVHAALLGRAAERGMAEIALHRLSKVIDAIASTTDRAGLAIALSAPDLQIAWTDTPIIARPTNALPNDYAHYGLSESMVRAVRVVPISTDAAHGEVGLALVSVQLTDGTWVNSRVLGVSLLSADDLAFRITVVGAALLLLLAAAIAARAVASPLVQLRNAVRDVPPGGPVTLPLIRGPLEVRELAQVLAASTRRAHDLLRQRSLALGALSHDIITPIARLKLRADDVNDPGLRAQILADLGEMEEMVNDVLAYLRGGDGGGEALVLLSVAAMVQVIIDEFAETGVVVVERHLDDVTVQARPVALKRAIRNLISNAVRYGCDPWVEVSATVGHVDIRVGDNGPRLSAEDLARAFEPFYRGDRARSRGEGSGLGLPTARVIAEAHGGRLSLVSAPGEGTIATLRLPLSIVPTDANHTRPDPALVRKQ